MVYKEIIKQMRWLADEEQAGRLMRFFKTGPGEYGEGDRFLGLKNPEVRAVIKEYRKTVEIDDVRMLLASDYHEVRLAGFLLLIVIYKRSRRQEAKRREIVDFYLSVIDKGNNWDLVDLVAPKILGDWLVRHPEDRCILDRLADMDGHLWHQRVAVVTTWTIIRNKEYADTIRLAEKLLDHPHDLIHKATGWMLREVGKRGGMAELLAFLDRYAARMPRTMLRYSIEQLPENRRRYYMTVR